MELPEDIEGLVSGIENEDNQTIPDMDSPEWDEFIMDEFTKDELDPDGHPKVHGLRRLAGKYVGNIVQSVGTIIFAPKLDDSGQAILPAVAEYKVKFLVEFNDTQEPVIVEYGDAADVSAWNADPKFGRFASALAVTRAETRALRKALKIKKCSSEEKDGGVAPPDGSENRKIEPLQIKLIDKLCKQKDINAWSYVNSGKNKYKDVKEIPYAVASKIIQNLNHNTKLSKDVIGYKEQWHK